MQSFISKIKAHRFVVAAVLPFSGKMKPFGTDALNGIRLALKEGRAQLGSNTLGIVVKDSALPPAQLHYEFEKVLKEFVPIALIGPLLARQAECRSVHRFQRVSFFPRTAGLLRPQSDGP